MNASGLPDTRRPHYGCPQPFSSQDTSQAVHLAPNPPTNPLVLVGQALSELAEDTAVNADIPDIRRALALYRSTLASDAVDEQESALLTLYMQLHTAGSRYAPEELVLLKARGGYHNYPGGISPLIMAGPYITPETVFIDLGAGNGLQGLLVQRIYPHKRTIHVELSAEMIRVGRVFQRALGISKDRVDWIHGDIIDTPLCEADFIYLYRPSLSSRNGAALYRSVAESLSGLCRPVVIFSVADCLGPFLDSRFSVFYTDGHLTCFSNK